MARAAETDIAPFSREAQEWFADYLIRSISVLGPLVGFFLIYRWYIGIMPANQAALSLLLLPFAFFPRFTHRLKLRTKSVILLSVFSVSAATTFHGSGLVGIGPLLSVLSAFTALVFYGNRVFLGLLAVMVLAVGLSGIAHINGLETEVDLSNPVNIIGKTGTVALIIVVFLFGMRGTTGLVAEQRELAKRKSREVERALEELRHFIQSANAPIFGVDKEGRVNEWNAMAAKITGYTREEALGSHLVNTYIADEHKQPVADVLERALAGANTANYELPLYSKSGERIEILLNATTRRNSDGSIVGVLGVGQDITDLREQERRLRQAHRVESVGHLAGGIAHDFNNLLAVIRGNVGIAISSLDGSEDQSFLQECLGDVATASADATKLTRQILSASSQQAFLQETVNLGSLVSDSLGKSSPRKSDSRVISLDMDEPDLAVVVDSAQLESAIVNLIENAKDSTESEGRISVKVSIEQLTGDLNSEYSLQAGEYIVITVSDDGCGIEENVLPKVTDPFFSTKEVGEGAGLGLSVVNGFVKKTGGELRLQSEPGMGTRVDMVLPLIRGRADAHAGGIEAERADFPRQTGTVLVVEDEGRLRKLAVRHLASIGFIVIEAGNAEEALTVLSEQGGEINILFSDIRMPGRLTGRQLAEEVSSLYPAVRTLLTTGYEDETGQLSDANPTGAGNVPVLRKPYSKSELIDAVIALDGCEEGRVESRPL